MVLRLVACFFFLTLLVQCDAQPANGPRAGDGPYTFQTSTRGGTGKYYMGREISYVMGHLGAGWLERPEREEEEKVSQAIANMNLEADQQIADIGAGSGYYAFRVAAQVPDGKVYAVDLQPEMLNIMRGKMKKNGVGNVELVRGTETDPRLAEHSIDLAYMVDVYHELAYPREMMQQVVKALKPGGRFILLEYRMEDPSVPIKRLHKMSEAQAVKEMQAVGLRLRENIGNLPWQHFMVFVKD